MKFSLIACINSKRALGKENKLLYHIPNDLSNFKKMTTDNVVVMGRKTFESLPNQKPLPNRVNIVITSNDDWKIDGEYDNLFVVDSIEMARDFCEAYYSDKECFIIGGSSIYNQCLNNGIINTIYLTTVNDDIEGDVYFPEINKIEWKTFYESNTQRHRTSEIDLTYKFLIFKKI